jgi:putative MATE family efflux protein
LRHPHDREILRLAVPAFGALVAEPLFLLADSAVVGRLGTGPLAGLGVAGSALTTLVGVCIFLAYGTTAAVARRLGAGDLTGALRQGIDGVWLAIGLGVVVALAGIAAAPAVVDALGASPAVHGYAVTYLRISLIAAPPMLVVLAGTGVLRGLQNTRTPLVVAIVAAVVNLGLNVLFVLGFGWGIAGSATGTAITQYGAAFAYGVVILRGAWRHGLALLPDYSGVLASARSGVALVVRTLSLRAVLVVATAVAARLGDAEVAAHQVAFAVWSLLAFALDAVAIAGQAITGRYLGASDVPAAREATRRMVEWGIGVGVVLGVAVLLVRPWLPSLFSADPSVRSLLVAVLLVVAVLQPLNGVVFVLDGVLIGAGDGRYLAWAGLATMVAFLPAAWAVLGSGAGLVALWFALGEFMLARLVFLALRAWGDRWMVTGAVR